MFKKKSTQLKSEIRRGKAQSSQTESMIGKFNDSVLQAADDDVGRSMKESQELILRHYRNNFNNGYMNAYNGTQSLDSDYTTIESLENKAKTLKSLADRLMSEVECL